MRSVDSVATAPGEPNSGKVSVRLAEVTPAPEAPGSASLIHYDAAATEDAGLFTRTGNGAQETRYAHWDLASHKVDWTVPLGKIDAHTLVEPIGVDPQGRHL
ncbi:MAG: hypothetical protein H7338_21185 [Candidatus Sericytochromatia bacterium]|nr:hypothetical protein [Candidatus Sericytochromatia bacterium]